MNNFQISTTISVLLQITEKIFTFENNKYVLFINNENDSQNIITNQMKKILNQLKIKGSLYLLILEASEAHNQFFKYYLSFDTLLLLYLSSDAIFLSERIKNKMVLIGYFEKIKRRCGSGGRERGWY